MCRVLQVQAACSLQGAAGCLHRESQRAVQAREEPEQTDPGSQRGRHRSAQTGEVSLIRLRAPTRVELHERPFLTHCCHAVVEKQRSDF